MYDCFVYHYCLKFLHASCWVELEDHSGIVECWNKLIVYEQIKLYRLPFISGCLSIISSSANRSIFAWEWNASAVMTSLCDSQIMTYIVFPRLVTAIWYDIVTGQWPATSKEDNDDNDQVDNLVCEVLYVNWVDCVMGSWQYFGQLTEHCSQGRMMSSAYMMSRKNEQRLMSSSEQWYNRVDVMGREDEQLWCVRDFLCDTRILYCKSNFVLLLRLGYLKPFLAGSKKTRQGPGLRVGALCISRCWFRLTVVAGPK